jgi:hypothetical protein
LFLDCPVIVEDEVVMFFCKGSIEVKDVSAIVLTLFGSMWEGEDCSCRGLAPGNKPIPGRFDGLGWGDLSSQDREDPISWEIFGPCCVEYH